MNAVQLSFASIKNRKLPSFLCVLAVACGIALLTSVFLLFSATENGLRKNAAGVDVVVGAKGSPLQLVLSTIYHGDIPTGNIDMDDMKNIVRNPQVKKAIPLAIGDNYKGFRVVGTTPEYIDLYKGEIADGKEFSANYEVVAGSKTGLAIGETFAAAHGFSADSDDIHDNHLYNVVGVLKPTGTAIDKLILTPYQSVQDLHSHHEHHKESHHEDPAEEAEEAALGHQVTALLVQVKTPAARMNLPRQLNEGEHIMAASPSHVMARVMKNSGFGKDAVILLACVFLGLAMLMLLSVLASGLAQRRYDLAVLRVLGASPVLLASTVLYEGLILSVAGSIAGVACGHLIAFGIASAIPALQTLLIPAQLLVPAASDIGFVAAGVACGAAASLIPCASAARTDIAGVLAQGR